MKNRKTPMRSCVVTREKLPKNELLRIVKSPNGEIVIDETGKLNGRGAYIKRDINVLDKAIRSKILDKVFETNIDDGVYEEIKKILNN